MTAYVSIPNSDVDPESPITTSLIIALRDNPTAITEGASGAPKIQTAAITNANVTRVKLPTATISLAGSLLANVAVNLSLHAYMFFPMFHGNTTAGLVPLYLGGHSTDGVGADNARCSIHNPYQISKTYDFDYRYINT